MAKNIVLCSDGTGNSANKDRGTNVFKLFEAVDQRHPKIKQIVFYDDGVGTSGLKLLKALGGAFGLGLSRNVRELYAALARSYKPGDQIYLFGFSRGAFTVRTLAGFINACGVVDREQASDDRELRRLVSQAYRQYRKRSRALISEVLYYTIVWFPRLVFDVVRRVERPPASPAEFRTRYGVKHATHAPKGIVPIRFLGVWDTVSAVGGPFEELTRLLSRVLYRTDFCDYELSDCVQQACHALSLDDERRTFHPLVWDERQEKKKRIEQVWFAGVHSNVGGGYPKQGMSFVAMKWMMDKATAAGLRLIAHDQELFATHANVHDKLYDSRAGIWVYYRYAPRDVFAICEKYGLKPRIHASVLDRIVQSTEGYAPGNVPRGLQFVPDSTTMGNPTNAAQIINRAFGQDTSLLDRARAWVWYRRVAHYVFLAASLVLVYLAVRENATLGGVLELIRSLGSLEGIFSLVVKLANQWWLVAIVLVMYVYGLIGQWAMNRVYSRFWYGLYKDLRAP